MHTVRFESAVNVKLEAEIAIQELISQDHPYIVHEFTTQPGNPTFRLTLLDTTRLSFVFKSPKIWRYGILPVCVDPQLVDSFLQMLAYACSVHEICIMEDCECITPGCLVRHRVQSQVLIL